MINNLMKNKLAKARKTRKSPGMLSLKKFGPGKLWFKKVWAQNIFIDFLEEVWAKNISINFLEEKKVNFACLKIL